MQVSGEGKEKLIAEKTTDSSAGVCTQKPSELLSCSWLNALIPDPFYATFCVTSHFELTEPFIYQRRRC